VHLSRETHLPLLATEQLAKERGILHSSRALSHHSKIVLGVLIEILCFDNVATQRSASREREVALIVPMRIAGRALALRRARTLALRQPPLWPLIPLPLIHSVYLP
jgi:hypothetical protein